MAKFKTFSHIETKYMEGAVNKWLKENSDIKIVSTSSVKEYGDYVSLYVFYETTNIDQLLS